MSEGGGCRAGELRNDGAGEHSPSDTGWKCYLQLVACSSETVARLRSRPRERRMSGDRYSGSELVEGWRAEDDCSSTVGNGGAIDKQKTLVALFLRQNSAEHAEQNV